MSKNGRFVKSDREEFTCFDILYGITPDVRMHTLGAITGKIEKTDNNTDREEIQMMKNVFGLFTDYL